MTPSRRDVRDAIVDALDLLEGIHPQNGNDYAIPFSTTTRSDRPNEFSLLAAGGVTFRIVVEQL